MVTNRATCVERQPRNLFDPNRTRGGIKAKGDAGLIRSVRVHPPRIIPHPYRREVAGDKQGWSLQFGLVLGYTMLVFPSAVIFFGMRFAPVGILGFIMHTVDKVAFAIIEV